MAQFIVRARRAVADGSVACYFAVHGGRGGVVATSGGFPKWQFDRMGGINGNFGVIAQPYDEKGARNISYLMEREGYVTEIIPVTEDMIVAGVVSAKSLMAWE